MRPRGRPRTKLVAELGAPLVSDRREESIREEVAESVPPVPIPQTQPDPIVEEMHPQPVPQPVTQPTQGQPDRPALEQSIDRLAQLVTVAVERQTQGPPKRENTIERVRSLGAENFSGTTEPADAESWLTRVERIFDVMRCTDDERVSFATFLLEGGAYHWWRSVSRRYGGVISWADFCKEFNVKFFPMVYQDIQASKFFELEQGLMTVEEYENRFIELSRFASYAIQNERDKCKRFEQGLRGNIRTTITAMGHIDFSELVGAAMRVERSLVEARRAQSFKQRPGHSWSVGGSSSSRASGGETSHAGYSGRQRYGQSPMLSGGQRQSSSQSFVPPSVGSNIGSQRPRGSS